MTERKRLSSLSRSLTGRSVIVTGAASGMGRATAHLFADEGAHVVVADLDRVDVVVAEIRAVHGDDAVIGVRTDVGDPAQLASLVDATIDAFGCLDAVINNAGVAVSTSMFDGADDYESNWATTLDINLTAHSRLVRLALPHLLESDAARVVNIASTEAIVTSPGMAAYAATKAGVVGLTKSMAVELGRHGVTVNCICPGPINTGMTSAIDEADKAVFAKRRTAIGRYGIPEEVAHGTLNFCLPASRFMTGAVLPVDGGLLIKNA